MSLSPLGHIYSSNLAILKEEFDKLQRLLQTKEGPFKLDSGFALNVEGLIWRARRDLNTDHYSDILNRLNNLLDKVRVPNVRLPLQISVSQNLLELSHLTSIERADIWLAVASRLAKLKKNHEALQAASTALELVGGLKHPDAQHKMNQAAELYQRLMTALGYDRE